MRIHLPPPKYWESFERECEACGKTHACLRPKPSGRLDALWRDFRYFAAQHLFSALLAAVCLFLTLLAVVLVINAAVDWGWLPDLPAHTRQTGSKS